MKKSSQNQPVGVSVPAIPERVSVAMSEIAENMHEGCWPWPWVRACR